MSIKYNSTGNTDIATDTVGGQEVANGIIVDTLGNKLKVNADGSLNVNSTAQSPTGLTNTQLRASPITTTIDQTTPGTTNKVSIGTDGTVGINAGSNAIGTVAINAAIPAGTNAIGTVTAVGGAASGSAPSGNPIRVASVGRSTHPSKTTDTNLVNVFLDVAGRSVVQVGSPRELCGQQVTTITSSTTETTIITAGGAGVFNDLTHLTISNSSATGTLVTIKDTTGGTTRAIYYVGPGATADMAFTPGFTQTSAAATWTATCGTSVASIYIVASYARAL